MIVLLSAPSDTNKIGRAEVMVDLQEFSRIWKNGFIRNLFFLLFSSGKEKKFLKNGDILVYSYNPVCEYGRQFF